MKPYTPLIPLKKVAKLTRGTEPGSKSYSNHGEIKFIRVSDLTGSREADIYVPESEDLVIINKDDVLFSLDGTPGVVTKGHSGAISSGIRKVEPIDPDQVLRDYLYYALQSRSVQRIVEKYSKGVTIKHASSSLEHIKIHIPSTTEQKQIVRKLQAIESVLGSQQLLKAEASSLREAILNTHFSLENAKKRRWAIKHLDEVCAEVYRYPTFYGFKFTKSGVPVLKISNFSEVDMFQTDLSKYDYITEGISRQFPKTVVKHGDLVMGVRGTYIGKCVPIPSFLEGANISPNLIRISPNDEIIRHRFLWHFTCSNWWSQQISRIVYYWKQKFGTIRSSQLKKVDIPTPELEVQDVILQQMSKSLTAIKEIDVVIKNCQILLKSMIDRTFNPEP